MKVHAKYPNSYINPPLQIMLVCEDFQATSLDRMGCIEITKKISIIFFLHFKLPLFIISKFQSLKHEHSCRDYFLNVHRYSKTVKQSDRSHTVILFIIKGNFFLTFILVHMQGRQGGAIARPSPPYFVRKQINKFNWKMLQQATIHTY